MRILTVSQMWPGPDDPDLGIFVATLERELSALGHETERAVIDRRGGARTKYARLTREALAKARSFRPDVVYGHFLVPAGLAAALAARASGAGLVLTAHGTDVANIGRVPGIKAATRFATSRAATVIAVSDWLRGDLVAKLPSLEGRVEVIDCGVDLERFAPREPRQTELERPTFVCVGSLSERKNVVRLAEAFERLGNGTLVFVGEGDQRPELSGLKGVRLVGAVPQEQVPDWIAAADVVCQPSLREPFGLATLEAMACARSVVATKVGGPPEFVPPEAGVLVDPLSVDDIERGLREAAELPSPNEAAREAAAKHDVKLQAKRIEAVLGAAIG